MTIGIKGYYVAMNPASGLLARTANARNAGKSL